jgi:Ca-activated chloride channel family protein
MKYLRHFIRQKNIIFLLLTLLFIKMPSANAWWWTPKEQPKLENIIQDLQCEQADHPEDPYINYNLGVAFYKANKFGQAESNFDRALIAATQPELKQRCYFNLGNSFYKDALTCLPYGWEAADVPSETIDMAIAKTAVAIKKYDDVLLLDKQHAPSKNNQIAAKELLKKLEKKKQQQQKDQQKKQQEKKNEQKNDQQKENEKKEQSPSQDQSNNQGEQEKNKDQQQDKQGSQEQGGKNSEQNSNNKGDQGNNNKQKDKDVNSNQQKSSQQTSHDKSPEQKEPDLPSTLPQNTPAAGQKQDQQQKQAAAQSVSGQSSQETMDQRGMRALFNDLQQNESELQKALMAKKMQENAKPSESNQRPW